MDRGTPNIDTDEGAGQQPGGEAHPGMPRWVKAFVVVGALLLVLIVVTRVTGGGHGPGRHGAPQDTEPSPPATTQESAPEGQQPPDGGTDNLHDPSRWGH